MIKTVEAGYMEQWTYNRRYSGVPQGSGVSPVLANVYLHELDKFMEEYAQKYNRGKKKQMNSDISFNLFCVRFAPNYPDVCSSDLVIYPQLIQKLFNAYWCGPPAGVTQPSTWPRVDQTWR